ncbi:hypothetical protein B296_00037466 [Ensete ventricosum]|uniref:Uncharacterized protein n=1 Tax=Ensete ventricosum TaxID=4639 RepID=A0A426Z759_ENSVE|nr:hypothetical protein B296_00037466 [Ensete ventricosum]
MASDGWRSGIPRIWDVNRPTNWERGSSLPWAIPKREAVVGLGRALKCWCQIWCLPSGSVSLPCLLSKQCWFRPMCASSPAVVSERSWGSGIGRNLVVRFGKSGARVVERGSEGASTVVGFYDPLARRGAGAYIAGVVDHPYLTTWLPMWLTMLLHTSIMPVVLAVGHASAGKSVDLTCVRPVVRPVAPPYLRPASFPRRVGHVDGPVVRGRTDISRDYLISSIMWSIIRPLVKIQMADLYTFIIHRQSFRCNDPTALQADRKPSAETASAVLPSRAEPSSSRLTDSLSPRP